MKWFLIGLAEIWRWRWKMGVPVLLGLVWGALHVLVFQDPFEARVLLQLQSEQAREPLLQKITATGHKEALYQKLINPEVLADSGHGLGVTVRPQDVKLLIFNDHFMGISYQSMQRDKIEQVADNLAFNFIQQVLAPERARIERLLGSDKQQLVDVIEQIAELKNGNGSLPKEKLGYMDVEGTAAPVEDSAAAPGTDAALRAGALAELELKKQQLENEIVQLQTSLRLVNTAFAQTGSEALLWFAQPATLVQQAPKGMRLLLWMAFGALAGYAASYLVFVLPGRWKTTLEDVKDVKDACGLPVVGLLPWLGTVKVGPAGAVVNAQGHTLRPSGFGEVARLHSALAKSMKNALVLVGVQGQEGVTLATLLLGERSAAMGLDTAIVDLNLKNRGLTTSLAARGEAWTMPKKGAKKDGWEALHEVTGQPKLRMLAAPRSPETLRQLGEAGGVHRLVDALGENAEAVAIDASPVAATNRGNVDAVAGAGGGARVVLVALAGVTEPGELRTAADTLLLSGANVQGVLLNMQFRPTRRQLIGEFANYLGPVGGWLRRAAANAKLD